MKHQLEIYSPLPAGSAIKVAIVPPRDILKLDLLREDNGAYTLTFEIPITSPAFQHVVRRSLVFLKEIGSSATPRKFRAMDILKSRREGEDGRLIATVTCEHITNDLAGEVIENSTLYASAAAEDLLTRIMDGSSFFAGTVSYATRPVEEFEVGAQTRLDNLRTLAEALDSRLVVNDDLTVDILARTALTQANVAVTFHPRKKNLIGVQNRADVRDLASRIFGFGGGDPKLKVTGAWHPIISGEQAYGGDKAISGLAIAHGDDALVGTAGYTYYIEFKHEIGVLHEITDFAAGTNPNADDDIAYDTAGDHGDFGSHTAPPEYGYFRLWVDKGSGAELLGWVEDREAYDEYGWVDGSVQDSEFQHGENLFQDPFLSRATYSSGVHPLLVNSTYFTAYASAILSENTDLTYIWNGTKSQRVQTSGHGQGVYCVVPMADAEDSEAAYFSAKVLVYLASGRITAMVSEGDMGNPGAGPGTMTPGFATQADNRIDISEVGWHTITLEGFSNNRMEAGSTDTPATYGVLHIVQLGEADAADFYVDSIQIEPSPNVSPQWIDGNTQRNLWVRAHRELFKRSIPIISHTLNTRDLYKSEPDRYPYDAAEVGDVARLVDEDLGLDDIAWISSKRENILSPDDVTFGIQTEEEAAQDATTVAEVDRVSRQAAAIVAISRSIKDRVRPMKVAASFKPDAVNGRAQRSLIFGGESGPYGEIVFAGVASHGAVFKQFLKVPHGRKVVWMFWPGESSESSFFAGAGLSQNIMGGRSAIPQAFSLQNTGSNAVTHIQTHITTYRALQQPGLAEPLMDMDNAWPFWIPPGEYYDLVLIAIGKVASGSNVTYRGQLLMFEVPLLTTQLGTITMDRGVTNGFYLDASVSYNPIGVLLHQDPGFVNQRGQLQIGLDARAETVNVKASSAAALGTDFYTLIADNARTVNPHRFGEVITEVRAIATCGPNAEPSPAYRERQVVNPAVTYA